MPTSERATVTDEELSGIDRDARLMIDGPDLLRRDLARSRLAALAPRLGRELRAIRDVEEVLRDLVDKVTAPDARVDVGIEHWTRPLTERAARLQKEAEELRAEVAIAKDAAAHWATRFNQAQEQAGAEHDETEAARAERDALAREAEGLRASLDLLKPVADAAERLLYSLGEYVRQSMHANPEWSDGVRTVETALFAWKKRERSDSARSDLAAARAEIERLTKERDQVQANAEGIGRNRDRLADVRDAWKALAKARGDRLFRSGDVEVFEASIRGERVAIDALRALGIDLEAP